MVRGKRLREKQRALIMRQKPRRGRRFGSVVRRKNVTIEMLRREVFMLLERGHSAEAACYAARKKFGAQFTPEGLRRFRIQMYRQAITGNSDPT